jgi:hypothetical protein
MKKMIVIAMTWFAIALVSTQASAALEIKAKQNSIQTLVGPTQRLSHYFGIVDINSYNYVDFVVTNRGSTFLSFQGAYISGTDLRARTDCSNGLMPNQQCGFTIVYNPFFEGYHSGLFELYFSEGNEIAVETWGEARRRW